LTFSLEQKTSAINANIRVGDGLVTLQGEQWMRHRSIIQPAFLAQSLNQMLTDLIPQLTTRLVTSWKRAQGREIELSSHLSALTLEIIGLAAFSHEFGALDNVQEWAEAAAAAITTSSSDDRRIDDHQLAEIDDPFIRAFTQAFQLTWIGTLSFILGMPFVSRWFNPKTRRVRKAMDVSVDAIIQEAKANDENGGKSSSSSSTNAKTATGTTSLPSWNTPRTSLTRTRKSLLELLLDARDGASKKSLDDIELRDEIKTFLFAGHETTSTWCYGAVWSLCSYPDVQEKVFQDVMKYSPSNRAEPLDLETSEKMEYFSAFMQEVLRTFPPIGMILRATTKEETFGTPHTVPKGTRITIPIYLLHHHPKYWDDPESFKPERWIFSNDKERDAFMSKIQFAFLPFSSGARNCIGQRFAVIEAHMIMAELIRHFNFQVAPSQRDTKFTFSNVVALKTKPRLKVVVKAR
jgi:cytochrome P450